MTKPKYPRSEALELARLNAIKMLGLHENNTPDERAKALGFLLDQPLYHGTQSDFPAFQKSNRHSTYATEDPEIADIYAESERRPGNAGPNVMPLVARGKKLTVSDTEPNHPNNHGFFNDNLAKQLGVPWQRGLLKQLPKHGYDRLEVNDMTDLGGIQTQHMFPEPEVLRSRFAAFDPARAHENDLHAAQGGNVEPTIEEMRQAVLNQKPVKAEGGRVPEHDLLHHPGQSKMIGEEHVLHNSPELKITKAKHSHPKFNSYRYLSYQNNEPVGVLQFMTDGETPKSAVIQNAYVKSNMQRQGIGSNLLARARQDFDLKHSDELSEAGKAFAAKTKAQGGNVNHFAKGGSEKALHFPPAPSLSQAEINAHAERMARQIEGIDNPNKKIQKQLAREQNLPVTIKGAKKADVPVIDYEKLLGSYTVGVPGDPSRGGVVPSKGKKRLGLEMLKAGETLHAIGGEKLDTPVPLYGGKDYGAYGHPAGWASDLGASAGMFNVVKRLAEENPERAVYGHYHKMSPESLNHAVHMLDAVLSHHRPHESSPKQIEMLNHLMRNVATTTGKSDVPYPTFPGFENPADVMLHGSMNSGMRKKIIGLLGKEKNFPGGKQKLDDIIYAISHPELRNIETGAGGNAVIKFDPTRELRESISPHPTYGHDIPSELVGKTRYITPMEILAPRSYNNSVQRNIGKPVMPFNDAKMNIIREPIDQQYVDQMKAYEEAMRKRLGYAKGGDVKEPTIDEMQAALALRKSHMAAGGQPKNPFDYENPEHVANVVKIAAQHKLLAPITDVHKHLADILSGGHYKHIEDPNIQNAIRQAGHDAYYVAEKSGKQSHIMNKADGGDVAIQQVGAEEAPNLPTKDFILPHGQHPGQLPVGGVDMQPAVPGQQLMPQQPGQQPQQGGQPPQGGPAPQGGPQGAPQPSNILQMTPQGRAMGAMQPQQPQQAKKGGTIKPVGHGITKEKVTISPNLDAMQYELMSVKHFKKAK